MKLHKLLLIISCVVFPLAVSAHQPRIVGESPTIVAEPEISKAYYGTLRGEPDVYRINAEEPFGLYVNVLVPGLPDAKKDISFAVFKDGDTNHPVALGEGASFVWKSFFEEYGHDFYWQGPEYRGPASRGTYEIRVWSSNNDSKYVLAIGEKEFFGFRESVNTLYLVPKLKKDFFNESPLTFLYSPVGAGAAAFFLVLLLVLGWGVRVIAKVFTRLKK